MFAFNNSFVLALLFVNLIYSKGTKIVTKTKYHNLSSTTTESIGTTNKTFPPTSSNISNLTETNIFQLIGKEMDEMTLWSTFHNFYNSFPKPTWNPPYDVYVEGEQREITTYNATTNQFDQLSIYTVSSIPWNADGIYTCKESDTGPEYKFNLTVIVEPRLTITNNGGSILNCSLVSNESYAELSWYKNGQLLSNSSGNDTTRVYETVQKTHMGKCAAYKKLYTPNSDDWDSYTCVDNVTSLRKSTFNHISPIPTKPLQQSSNSAQVINASNASHQNLIYITLSVPITLIVFICLVCSRCRKRHLITNPPKVFIISKDTPSDKPPDYSQCTGANSTTIPHRTDLSLPIYSELLKQQAERE